MNPKFSAANAPIKLYRFAISGHSHRVELMLSLLDLPYENIDLDLPNGEHKQPEYLKINPFGQVPAIDDNGVILADSNAILVYLATKYQLEAEWLPTDPVAAAEVQRWLSVAAGEIAAGPCAARLVKVFGVDLNHAVAVQKSNDLFAILESILQGRAYLAGSTITLADVAGYSYIAHAPEGGLSLAPYPAIRDWVARVEAQPRFVGMQRTPVAHD